MALAYDDLIQPFIVRQESKRRLYCMCTRTQTPPFCDGSHLVTEIRPHAIELEEPQTMAICACWKSQRRPFCDGTHGRLVKQQEKK